MAHACLQSLDILSHTHALLAAHCCSVGFASAQPAEQPVEGEKLHSVLALQSAAFLALEHVPMQDPDELSQAQKTSAVQAAAVVYLYWHRAVQPVPLTTWQALEALQVAGSLIAEHLPVHVEVAASQTQSV